MAKQTNKWELCVGDGPEWGCGGGKHLQIFHFTASGYDTSKDA